jgi:hypothetical protein
MEPDVLRVVAAISSSDEGLGIDRKPYFKRATKRNGEG